MARFKETNYDQTVMIPLSYSNQLIPGTMEYAINDIVDNYLDLSIFEKRYKNEETGAPAWYPAVMLKIILFGYSRGIISSRDLEFACRKNIIFKALSANSEPHFTSIANFVSTMKNEIQPIFIKILLICSDLDLIGGEMFAIDGSKISSNASKEWSGTFKELENKKVKLKKKLEQLIRSHEKQDKIEEKKKVGKNKNSNDGDNDNNLTGRKRRYEKDIEKITKFLEKNEPRKGTTGNEVKSNITDNESAKMKSSHGMIQGYNGMAVADSKNQIIIYPEAFGQGPEQPLLKPMIEGVKKMFQQIGKGKDYLKNKKLAGDCGSYSEENLKYLSGAEIDAYIPDERYRKRDPRFAGRGRHKPEKKQFGIENFKFIKEKNQFICPDGKIVKFYCKAKVNNSSGRKYRASPKDCKNCKLREKCLQRKTTTRRTLYVIDKYHLSNYSKAMRAKIDTPEGRKIYSRRMQIIEPVFGNIKSNKGLNKFTLRTKDKVNIQWILYCLVHNIEKICRYGNLTVFERG
ncbi:MAG: IS1182 family transposase [Actinomycetia bacterium]|nr:IS1182 family transposase [Actinomycetes bacterium]